jgi:hypothetical protein
MGYFSNPAFARLEDEYLVLLFLATFIDSFVGQQIVKAAVFLRLNHRVALPISHHYPPYPSAF